MASGTGSSWKSRRPGYPRVGTSCGGKSQKVNRCLWRRVEGAVDHEGDQLEASQPAHRPERVRTPQRLRVSTRSQLGSSSVRRSRLGAACRWIRSRR